MVDVRYYEVTGHETGQRLDNYLLARLKDVPRSHVYRMIRRGEVRVNKRRAKPLSRLSPGDTIRVPVRGHERDERAPLTRRPPARRPMAEDLRRRILHEDDSLLVVNKRAGEVVHAGSRHGYGLVDQLDHAPGGMIKPVHRLDRGTTGCVAFAKSRPAMLALHAAFRGHEVEKIYQALVAGRWDDAKDRSVSRDDGTGKRIETRFLVLRRYPHFTLLEVRPVTGKKHQIRIHTAAEGHPIIGDRVYGNRANEAALPGGRARRLFLHAWRLSFTLGCKRYSFEAPLPEDWERLNKMGSGR